MLDNEGKWGPVPDVLWLRLMDSNEGVNDIIGTNDGTLNGGMGYGSGGDGRRSAVFDGVDDYITIPHFSGLNFGTGSFSLAFWMKTSDTGYKFLFDKENGPQFAVMINNGGANKLDFYQYNGSATYRTSSATVNDGAWHHIACVRAASTAPSIYVDGALSNGALVGSGVKDVSNTGNLYIGDYASGGFKLNGKISDLRIFSRALSAAEVARLARIY